MPNEFRNFLELSYEELEELNLKANDQRRKRVAIDKVLRQSASEDIRRQDGASSVFCV